MVVAKTLDLTQAEDEVTSLKFMAKGDLLHGMSAIPVKSSFTEIEVSIRRKVCERTRQGPTFEIIKQGRQNHRSPNALSFQQRGNCAEFIEANMEFARKKSRGSAQQPI